MVVFFECSRPIVSDLKQSEFVSEACKLLFNQVSFFCQCLCTKCLKKKYIFVLGLLSMVRFNNNVIVQPISHNGIFPNSVPFHDHLIFFTSSENKGQLDHPNSEKKKLLVLLLFSYVVNVG